MTGSPSALCYGILKKSSHILRKGNRLDQYQFIDKHKQEFGVRWLLRRMSICPNTYYNYRKDRKVGYREEKEKLKEKILQIYHEYSGNLGYQMMRVYLFRAKIRLSNTTVLKYMQELGIKSTVVPQKLTYKKGDCYKKFENHRNREFHSEKPNEKWCTDFTYIVMEDGSIITVALSICLTDLWWQPKTASIWM